MLTEPFFKWVPPGSESHNLNELPTKLEELTEQMIRNAGMERYLIPHGGLDEEGQLVVYDSE